LADILKQLGKKVRSLRQAQNMTQEKMSYACDLDRTYLVDIEKGKRNPSVLVLQKLAKGLRIKPKDLLDYQ